MAAFGPFAAADTMATGPFLLRGAQPWLSVKSPVMALRMAASCWEIVVFAAQPHREQ